MIFFYTKILRILNFFPLLFKIFLKSQSLNKLAVIFFLYIKFQKFDVKCKLILIQKDKQIMTDLDELLSWKYGSTIYYHCFFSNY